MHSGQRGGAEHGTPGPSGTKDPPPTVHKHGSFIHSQTKIENARVDSLWPDLAVGYPWRIG